jgi:hypothetical protein
MPKVKFSKKERTLILSIIKEKLGALDGKLRHFEFLDKYDRDQFPDALESELKEEITELKEIAERLGEHLKDD